MTDGGRPQRAVQKGFVLRVTSALSLKWKAAAQVNGNRIEGSVEVSNTTRDDMDLTFYRAGGCPEWPGDGDRISAFCAAAGHETGGVALWRDFAPGGYVVHVDAVGEVAAKKLIYRERLETPGLLQVTVGP